MFHYRRVILDMTPDGKFRPAPKLPLGTRIAIVAAVLALIVGGITLGAFLVGIALALIPLALIALGVAYVAWRFERWRSRHRSSSGGGQDIFPS
jgi:CHASE2 domain-containing sensor protein